MIFKFGGKIDLTENKLVFEKAFAWAQGSCSLQVMGYCRHSLHAVQTFLVTKAFSEKKIQTVKLEKNQYGLMVELREVQRKRSKDKTFIWR